MNELVGAAIGGGGGGGVTAESVLQIQMQQQLYCTTTAKIPQHNSKNTTTQQQRYHNYFSISHEYKLVGKRLSTHTKMEKISYKQTVTNLILNMLQLNLK